MSVSVYAHVVIGVPMKSGELLVREPTGLYKCRNGHSKSTGPFCSECGGKMSQSFNETFIPSFVKYAESIGKKPKELFESWIEGDWDDADVENPSLGFHELPNDGSQITTRIFGIKIASTSNLMYSSDPKIVSVEAIPKLEKIIVKVLSDLFGAKALIPEVYLYGYSC